MSEQVKKNPDEFWPNKCPSCGNPAFLGFNQYKCVSHPSACPNGNLDEHNEYLKTVAQEIEEASEEVPEGGGEPCLHAPPAVDNHPSSDGRRKAMML